MDKDKHSKQETIRKKNRVISARFSEMEYQALQKRRKDAGVSMSHFTRSIMMVGKVVQHISKADADILRKLAGEANNVNQLAHKANSEGFSRVAGELVTLKLKIVEIINILSDDWKNNKRSKF